jgi:hypothetical protein
MGSRPHPRPVSVGADSAAKPLARRAVAGGERFRAEVRSEGRLVSVEIRLGEPEPGLGAASPAIPI